MCDAMVHRGPDDEGQWSDQQAEVGLGHRRLSIIDLSPTGHQPMSNEDKSVWISYNGEIYNFRELRNELEGKGHTFHGTSDTEVLLHLYEEHGVECLNKLNGIFAFAVWDAGKRRLILARDHAGVKPLYYWQAGRTLFFASEIKALLRVPELPRELNHARIPDLLQFLWVPGSETLLKGVRKVEPGHCLLWQDGKLTDRRWFRLNYEPERGVSEAEWTERVRKTFRDAVERQMVSDVPLGAFLSGGLDSSGIVACMRRAFPDRDICCYTAAPDADAMASEGFVDDFPYAQRVAQHLGVTLKHFPLKPDVVDLLPKMVYHLDEPDADPAVFPSYLISRFAREDGIKVLLSGTGGDEVFFGYRSHQAYRMYEQLRWLPRPIGSSLLGVAEFATARLRGPADPAVRRLAKFRRGFAASGLDRHLAIVDWSSTESRRALLSPELRAEVADSAAVPACMRRYWGEFGGAGALNQHSHMLVQTFLASHNFLYTDKTSMATSVEARVPFMDVELMRLCARIPESLKLQRRTTKTILKRALEQDLPADVLHRGKTGFGAPLRTWIRQDLAELVDDTLCPTTLSARGLFEAAAVRELLAEHRTGAADHAYLIYALLNLELWTQAFVDSATTDWA